MVGSRLSVAARLEALIAAQAPQDRVCAGQVKETFGGVRFYLRGGIQTYEMTRAIEDAQCEAWKTCEVCGRTGMLHDSTQWYSTRCNEHAPPNAVPVREEHDRLDADA